MVKASMVSAIALALGAGAASDAAEKPAAEPNAKVERVKVVPRPESPQATVADFLEYVRTGKDNIAATYLELTPKTKDQGSELARQLAAVLQSQPNFEVDDLSPDWNGDTEDGLPEAQEDIAFIAIDKEKGAPQPVRLISHPDTEPTWRFAIITVAQIPSWYERTPSAWVTQHLPNWLQKRGPAGVQFWQWVGLFLIVFAGWLLGFLVSRLVHAVAGRIVAKTDNKWDDLIVKNLQGPIALACSLGVASVLAPYLDLSESSSTMLFRLIRGGFLAVVFWVCVRGVDFARQLIIRAQLISSQPASRSLISLGARFTKAILFVVLVIAVLSQLGFPVASLLAGLGIGGLAVALAGQKTLENLIGTFAIGFDQPFREGDFVKVRDFSGTVETIGLRSTRFRTLDRTLITMPNGKLADEAIESFAARDRVRLSFTLQVRYGVTADQLRVALTRLEADVKKVPKVDEASISVKLTSLNEASMAFEVVAMINTSETAELATTRQALLLQMMATLDELDVQIQPTMPLAAVGAAEGSKNGTPQKRAS